MSDKVKKGIGIALIVLGGLSFTKIGFLGMGLIAAGIIILRKLKKDREAYTGLGNFNNQPEEFQFSDEMIVRLAKMKGGMLTAEELASQSSLNLEQSKERLDALHLKNVVELRVTDSGVIVYDFRGNQISDDDKFNSKNLLDM